MFQQQSGLQGQPDQISGSPTIYKTQKSPVDAHSVFIV